jgi:hypothetical protein
MVGRPARREGLNAVEAELGEIKPLDEDVDRADRIIVADIVVKHGREQRALAAIAALHKPRHRCPRRFTRGS